MRNRYLILLVLSCGFLLSCHKEKTNATFTKRETNTHSSFDKILFTDALRGYAVGGSRFDFGTFLKTTDGGKTWSKTDTITDKELYDMYFFSRDTGLAVAFDGKIMVTNDGGDNWSFIRSDFVPFNKVAFHGQLGIIAVGGGYSSGDYYVTRDRGQSWIEKTHYQRDLRGACFSSNGNCFLSGYGVVLRSTDSCRTFTPLNLQGDFFLDIDFPDDKTGYVAGYEGDFWKTTDGGDNWKKIHLGSSLIRRLHIWDIQFLDAQTGFAVGDNGLFLKTIDGGDHWLKPEKPVDANLRSIFAFDENHGFVCGEDGALYEFQF